MNERLAKLAELHGVERGYEDVFHKWQETTEGAMSAVLASMGVKTGSNAQIEASIAAHERESRRRVVPHVWVRRAANLREGIPIHLPGDALTHTLAWRIVEEDGSAGGPGKFYIVSGSPVKATAWYGEPMLAKVTVQDRKSVV